MIEETSRPLVYVSGPIGDDPSKWDENLRNSILVAEDLYRLGCLPFVPHLSVAWHKIVPHTPAWWLTYDIELLAKCDGIFMMPGHSVGAEIEERFANRQRTIHVLHSYADVSNWLRRGVEGGKGPSISRIDVEAEW